MEGERVKSVKPHSASIIDISLDETADFIATASLDGECTFLWIVPFPFRRIRLQKPMDTRHVALVACYL